MFFTQDSIVLF